MHNVPHACMHACLQNNPFYTAGFKGNPATHHRSTLHVCVCDLCIHLSAFSSVCKDIILPGLQRPPSN